MDRNDQLIVMLQITLAIICVFTACVFAGFFYNYEMVRQKDYHEEVMADKHLEYRVVFPAEKK